MKHHGIVDLLEHTSSAAGEEFVWLEEKFFTLSSSKDSLTRNLHQILFQGLGFLLAGSRGDFYARVGRVSRSTTALSSLATSPCLC